MNVRTAARRVAAMSWRERRTAGEAVWELVLMTTRLRLMSWQRASGGLLVVQGHSDPAGHQRVVATVERVANHLPGHPTCLPPALAAQRMLRRRSVASEVAFDLPDPISGRPGHARAATG